jgi:hypothetical protein
MLWLVRRWLLVLVISIALVGVLGILITGDPPRAEHLLAWGLGLGIGASIGVFIALFCIPSVEKSVWSRRRAAEDR